MAEKGRYLAGLLEGLDSDKVTQVRGLGLMVGLQLTERVRPCLERLAERGVLALPAGPKVLRLLPPLIISRDELKEVAGHVGSCLAASQG